MTAANADPLELEKFSDLAHRWWDPESEFKPLHDINPLRLDYIDRSVGLRDKRVLDVGCGGGILCPMCGQRDASTLDHYLPKGKNPSLAVTPVNLVPVCKECNHTKWEYHPETADKQFIHTYYDKLPVGTWLVADLDQSKPPALKFRVSPPIDCDETLGKRLAWHFEELNLAKLYASQAGKTLAGIADKLKAASDRGSKNEVRFVLGEDARSWSKANLNGWQAAMYRTLASSDWFCEEGYAYAGEKHKREEK